MFESEMKLENVLTAEKFSLEVERRYVEHEGDFTHLELAAEYLEELGIDPENGKPLIAPPLFEKIKQESIDRHLLKERNTTQTLW